MMSSGRGRVSMQLFIQLLGVRAVSMPISRVFLHMSFGEETRGLHSAACLQRPATNARSSASWACSRHRPRGRER